ncbi:MAG: hypothetical protein NVSMB65_22460 [Chloroflexota bacterium]
MSALSQRRPVFLRREQGAGRVVSHGFAVPAQIDGRRSSRVALITGAASGLAKGIALAMARDGDRVAFTLWQSEEAMRSGMQNANAVPLLPGQRGEDIPSPTRVELLKVVDEFVAG